MLQPVCAHAAEKRRRAEKRCLSAWQTEQAGPGAALRRIAWPWVHMSQQTQAAGSHRRKAPCCSACLELRSHAQPQPFSLPGALAKQDLVLVDVMCCQACHRLCSGAGGGQLSCSPCCLQSQQRPWAARGQSCRWQLTWRRTSRAC